MWLWLGLQEQGGKARRDLILHILRGQLVGGGKKGICNSSHAGGGGNGENESGWCQVFGLSHWRTELQENCLSTH